jgi:hypothetical protein
MVTLLCAEAMPADANAHAPMIALAIGENFKIAS